MYRRVVVTGIGAVTPYGQSEDFFEQLLAGNSAIGSLSAVPKHIRSYCHVAGQVNDFNPADFVPAKTAGPLKQAKWKTDEIDYINAHATSTVVGDCAEANAIKTFLGESDKKVAVSATKSMTGHMLGAVGSIEAAISCLAIFKNAIPPTINLHSIDPTCVLNHVANTRRSSAFFPTVLATADTTRRWLFRLQRHSSAT
jgi:3-oxoacyl-(acyl-carrier-protein) synthase